MISIIKTYDAQVCNKTNKLTDNNYYKNNTLVGSRDNADHFATKKKKQTSTKIGPVVFDFLSKHADFIFTNIRGTCNVYKCAFRNQLTGDTTEKRSDTAPACRTLKSAKHSTRICFRTS